MVQSASFLVTFKQFDLEEHTHGFALGKQLLAFAQKL